MTILIQSCSASKQETTDAVPAKDLYTGFFYRIIKKALREGEFVSSVDWLILSAEHGLITPDTEISWYDREMTHSRATEIADDVQTDLAEYAARFEADTIVVNAGRPYRAALHKSRESLSHNFWSLTGSGIGKRSQMKRFIRGKSVNLEPWTETMEELQ